MSRKLDAWILLGIAPGLIFGFAMLITSVRHPATDYEPAHLVVLSALGVVAGVAYEFERRDRSLLALIGYLATVYFFVGIANWITWGLLGGYGRFADIFIDSGYYTHESAAAVGAYGGVLFMRFPGVRQGIEIVTNFVRVMFVGK